MASSANIAIPQGLASSRYGAMTSDRDPYLQRARELSELTIPSLFRPDGSNGATQTELGWTSLGAWLVKTLAAKVTLTLFPVGRPPMKLSPTKEVKLGWAQMAPDQRAPLEEATTLGLSKVEQEFVEAFDEDGDRARLNIAMLKMVVGGQQGIQFYPDGTIRGISLERHVTKRDPSGNLIEFAICDPLSWETLPPDVQASCIEMGYVEPKPGENPPAVDVYTYGMLRGGKWTVFQEVYSKEVTDSRRTYLPEFLPYLFLPWVLLDGEHYGRPYCEDYEADLQTVEGLTQTVTEGSAAVARFLMFVNPAGLTNKKAVAEAENGAVLSGRADDVTVLETNKSADFQTAAATSDKAETRLRSAFLVGARRQGERVTAEEIRQDAADLDMALGGVYSQQTVTFQTPFCRLKMHYLQAQKRVTPLPKGTTKVVVTGGLAALGRNADLQAMDDLINAPAVQVFGPQAVIGAFGPDFIRAYFMRRAAALGINPDGLIPTAAQVAQQQVQAQQQAAAQQLGPEAVKQIGQNITANQVAATQAGSKLAVEAQKQVQSGAQPETPPVSQGA